MGANDPNDMYRQYPPQPPVDPWQWQGQLPRIQLPEFDPGQQVADWYEHLLRQLELMNQRGMYGG